jgi:hypothetical protein
MVDSITLDFEAASGALLNRNRKTLILGLGSWAGRQDWPLPWLQAATSIKVLGFEIHPTFTASVEATWTRVLAGLRSTVQSWSSRRLPILLQRVQVLEVYVSSKAWYFAQVIPLSASAAASLRSILGDFVWAHSLARLAFPALLRRRPRPLLPYQEGPVPACQADPASACRWRPDCHTPSLLDGNSPSGPPTSSHRSRHPHGPASAAVH